MEQSKKLTALLVLDMQEGTLAMLPAGSNVVENTAKAIAAARERNMLIVYAALGFREGGPEISPNNKSFSSLKTRLATTDMNAFMRIPDRLAPRSSEVTITKRRVSAFTGSDLEVILRASGIQHLVLAGISTSGVILSTMREAIDKDYIITILEDCCADGDEEVHRVLITKIFPRHASVISVADWL